MHVRVLGVFQMSRHIEEIKELIFDELDFDEEETTSKKDRTKDTEKRTPVETIVFRDRAKRKKVPQVKRSLLIGESPLGI